MGPEKSKLVDSKINKDERTKYEKKSAESNRMILEILLESPEEGFPELGQYLGQLLGKAVRKVMTSPDKAEEPEAATKSSATEDAQKSKFRPMEP